MTKTWRVGVLGLGHWYSAYMIARALPEYPRAELAGVAWRDKAQREEFVRVFGGDAYGDYDALLERPDVDVVLIATPVREIPDLTIRAARAGKHVILGKPMAMNLAEADRMVDAVEEAGVTCIPFQGLMRFLSLGLKSRIEQGEIGDVILMHQTARWSIAEDWYESGRPGWFVDPEQVPGGALIDEGIYWIDLFPWLAGAEVKQVEARTANLVHKDLRVEDWGMATLTFDSGVIATLEGSWTVTAPRTTGPSPKQNSVVRTEIVGTGGEIIEQWFRDPGRAVLASGASDWVFERQAGAPFAPPSPAPLDHLIACVEDGATPIATIRDARNSFAVAMAAYESAATGRPVRPLS